MTKFKQFLGILTVLSLSNLLVNSFAYLISYASLEEFLGFVALGQLFVSVCSASLVFDAEKEYKQKEIYIYNDKQYIFRKLISVKNNETREWETYVLYSDSTGNNLYARNQEEFNERFKRVE